MTGGTGFLGRSLLDYFIESARARSSPPQVTVLSRNPELFLRRYPVYDGLPWLRFIHGDLNALPAPRQHCFTDVIHAAAEAQFSGNPLAWLDQLVAGTRAVLDFAVSSGVERLLFVSSGAVYGKLPEDVGRVREDSPFSPLTSDIGSTYGHGKRMAEHLCSIYTSQYGLECVMARCFSIISKHIPLEGRYAAGNFLRDALGGRNIVVKGNGSAVRSYMDGRDAAHWLLTLLLRGARGEAYNVGSDVPVTIYELAKHIARQGGESIGVTLLGEEIVEHRSRYVPDIGKATAIGLRVDTSLELSISSALRGLRSSTAR